METGHVPKREVAVFCYVSDLPIILYAWPLICM